MLTPEIIETAKRLEQLIEAEEKTNTDSSFASEVCGICQDILAAANVEDLGGCPLCQS